jgi:cell division protein FtsA
MAGMAELAEEIFHMPVRLGVPQYVGSLSDVVRNPSYSTAVGLVLFGYRHQEERESRTGRISAPTPGELANRIKQWFLSHFKKD